MSWNEAQDKVIEATCPCGATFKVIAQFPMTYYSKWLEKHEGHVTPPNLTENENE